MSDNLEPACQAFVTKKYGEMFEALGGNIPAIKSHTDKGKWSTAMERLISLRISGSVGDE
jgi:DNA helicase-2/ATP-dependent DNA helicase PcrA